MKVVILCGGEGMRLREYTENIPKPMIEIGGKPILWHIMKIYKHYGFDDFVICLGYKGEKIKEYFKKNDHEFGNIIFADTGPKSSKAERLKMAEKYIDTDNFFLAYGDDVSDVDIKKISEFHKKNDHIVTLTSINLVSPYGILKLNGNDEITGFVEKPVLEHWINGGFFVMSRKIFDYLTAGKELEDDVFKELAEQRKISAFKHKGFWKSMNTLKDVKELNDIWNSGNIPWKKWK